jgi:hypothetical protein
MLLISNCFLLKWFVGHFYKHCKPKMQLEIVRTGEIEGNKVLQNRRRSKIFLKHYFMFIGKLVGILGGDEVYFAHARLRSEAV